LEFAPYLFGIVIGLSLGLTGAGGSIFAVPLLIYGLQIAPGDAIGISLAAVALTAAFGAVGAMRARLVDYRVALLFAAGGMLAAPLGIRIGHHLSDAVVIPLFAILMILVAVSLWIKAQRSPAASSVVRAESVYAGVDADGAICRLNENHQLHLTGACGAVLGGAGIVTGLLSGLFGVGGGFVIVPALRIVTELEIHRAVATSLFVITLIGLSGVGAMFIQGKPLPWLLTGLFVAGGFTGMFIGRLVARRIAGPRLEKLFAAAMILVAALMFVTRA